MSEVVHINESDFREAMLNLRRKGGSHQRAYNEACRIISSLSFGVTELNKLTKHGESRISHCIKYDISNDAHRLITVHSDHYIYLLFVGTHDDAEKWLDRNRGLTVTFNRETKRVTVTHITREERRTVPQLDYSNLRDNNESYMQRIGFDPTSLIQSRLLVKAINAVNDSTSDEDLEDLLADLGDYDQAIGNLMMDVLFEIREGRLDGAKARLDEYTDASAAVQNAPDQEQEAVRSDANADQIAVLTGLTKEQLENLFSKERFQEWMLWLHPDQKKVVEADYEGSTVLTGVSGSGKTCIVVHRARRLALKHPGERIGVITLNRSLCRLIENQIHKLCELHNESVPPNIYVMAFYDYFQQLLLHFGPEKEIEQLKQLAAKHPEKSHILETLSRVNPKTYAREFDPQSGEQVSIDTWEIFMDQRYVQTLFAYFRDHVEEYDLHTDPERYLKEEFSLLRSAIPTSSRVRSYLNLERNGRAIPFPRKKRYHILDLLLLFEETMIHGGVMDELGLTLALVPHISAFRELPEELRFRSLLIDEFQDFSTRDLALLRLVPTGKENALFISGDTVQRVMVKDLRLGAVGFDITTARWERIKKNYRNSRQILLAASALANAHGAIAKKSGVEIEVLDPELAIRETLPPVAVHSSSEVEAAWHYAHSCLRCEDDQIPWSICIVTASPEIISVNELLKMKPHDFPVPVSVVTGDYIRGTDTVSVATMSEVKGFDFSLVLVVGCGASALPDPKRCKDEAWRDALRLYVAMTRARDEVRLFYSGEPSEFLIHMSDHLQWTSADTDLEDK